MLLWRILSILLFVFSTIFVHRNYHVIVMCSIKKNCTSKYEQHIEIFLSILQKWFIKGSSIIDNALVFVSNLFWGPFYFTNSYLNLSSNIKPPSKAYSKISLGSSNVFSESSLELSTSVEWRWQILLEWSIFPTSISIQWNSHCTHG